MGNRDKAIAFEIANAIPKGDCLLTHRRQKSKYPRVTVWREGKRWVAMVHQLIMEQREGECPPGMEIRHLCGNSQCINPDHLVYDTRSENARDTQ